MLRATSAGAIQFDALIASVTDNGTGDMATSFDTAMVDNAQVCASFSIEVGTFVGQSACLRTGSGSPDATGVRCFVQGSDDEAALDPTSYSVIIGGKH